MPSYAAYIRVELTDVEDFYQAQNAAHVLAKSLPKHALAEDRRHASKSTPVRDITVDNLTIISNK